MMPQFTKYSRLKRRAAKVKALVNEATPEARKARKAMNDHVVKRERMNLNGFYGTQRVRGKEKKKSRKVRASKPYINAIKSGY